MLVTSNFSFSQCVFKRLVLQTRKNQGLFGKGLINPLLHRCSFWTHQQQTAFENIVEKGEIAHNEQFLLFPQCFLLNHMIVSPFVHIFDIISLFTVEFEELKIGISGKEIINIYSTLSTPDYTVTCFSCFLIQVSAFEAFVTMFYISEELPALPLRKVAGKVKYNKYTFANITIHQDMYIFISFYFDISNTLPYKFSILTLYQK